MHRVLEKDEVGRRAGPAELKEAVPTEAQKHDSAYEVTVNSEHPDWPHIGERRTRHDLSSIIEYV